MKKKNRFKSWLIKVLRKWLKKLEPEYNIVKIERTTVPLVTLEANVVTSKRDEIPQEDINRVLEKHLGEQIMQYADVEQCHKIDMSVFDEQIIYRATVRVAVDKRG
jgi:hypothetical protein